MPPKSFIVQTTASEPDGSELLDKLQSRIKTSLDSLSKSVLNTNLIEVTLSGGSNKVYHGLGFSPVSMDVVGTQYPDYPSEPDYNTNTNRASYVNLTCSGVNTVKLRFQ